MKNLPLLLATLGGTLILIFGVAFLFGRTVPPELIDTMKLKAGSRHVLLPTQDTDKEATPSAKVTPKDATAEAEASQSAQKKVVQVVEFSDLQCPACKAASPLIPALRQKFPGQVEIVFRDYPLDIHPNSHIAAYAAEAAGKFDKFWEMHDLLFEKQSDWENLGQDDAKAKFVEYAMSLKIEKDPFTAEMNSDTVKTAVQSDINLGNEIKISATPTFFVDGKKVSAPDLEEAVTQALSQ